MAQQAASETTGSWEKPANAAAALGLNSRSQRLKFLIGGLLILGAIGYLIISSTGLGARYFISVNDLVKNSAYTGQTVRITGAVIGSTIQYDSKNLVIHFTVADVPDQYDNLAVALHDAVVDPKATHLNVVVENQPMPDLLRDEAQAIMTGTLSKDGVFHASELLLKCPSRFDESNANGLTKPT
jgi:cytochrome c-type biogenesis protein CcmE